MDLFAHAVVQRLRENQQEPERLRKPQKRARAYGSDDAFDFVHPQKKRERDTLWERETKGVVARRIWESEYVWEARAISAAEGSMCKQDEMHVAVRDWPYWLRDRIGVHPIARHFDVSSSVPPRADLVLVCFYDAADSERDGEARFSSFLQTLPKSARTIAFYDDTGVATVVLAAREEDDEPEWLRFGPTVVGVDQEQQTDPVEFRTVLRDENGNVLETLLGALPPPLLRTLAVQSAVLLTASGGSAALRLQASRVVVGGSSVDLDSYVDDGYLAAATKSNSSKSRRVDVRARVVAARAAAARRRR